MPSSTGPEDVRVSTGVAGLDAIVGGGLIPGRSYLVRGSPGAGKSILGLHFLTDGAARDQTSLYINLEEPTGQIRENAASLGFDLDAVEFLDVTPDTEFFAEDRSYSVFEPDQVESGLTDRIVSRVEEADPDRVFLDPVTHMRYLTADDYQFRKQVISFMRFLKERNATVLFTSQESTETPDHDLQFLADGIVELGQQPDGRSVSIPKFRGSDRQAGVHSVRITDEGMAVYPELVPGEYAAEFTTEAIPSGVDELDALLGGGIERGTITVVSGPTGVGKTTTGSLFLEEAAARGETSALFLFEEGAATLRHRADALGMDLPALVEEGTLAVEEVEPLDLSPEQFAARVRTHVEDRGADVVMLDGIQGYKLSLRGKDDALVRKLHALGRYLKNMGVTVVFVDEVDTVTGEFRATNAGISYLADNILFLRHVELGGELRKSVGVLKKRVGSFERTLREFELSTEDGVVVGEPLEGMRGILRGTPTLETGDWEP